MKNLTYREHEVLIRAARLGQKQAAAELGISHQTVKNTLYNVYRKLGVHSMAHAILVLQDRKRHR